jgi:membrane-associated PAP2 superfamily phosphatase
MTLSMQTSNPNMPWVQTHGWRITAVLLALVVIWDLSGWDLLVMQWFGSNQGFALKENWWLSTVMHTRAQQLAVVAYVFLLAMVFWPLGPFRAASRRQRVASLLAITASLVAVSILKRFSLTSCPWDLSIFGGPASHVSHWSLGVSDGGGGRCFPSGHASSALAFMAASFPALFSQDASRHRHGRALLLLVVLLGVLFGLTQTVRGAHYPSHTLWTAWICWTTGWLTYRWTAGHPTPTA